jgi:hypothetical protein
VRWPASVGTSSSAPACSAGCACWAAIAAPSSPAGVAAASRSALHGTVAASRAMRCDAMRCDAMRCDASLGVADSRRCDRGGIWSGCAQGWASAGTGTMVRLESTRSGRDTDGYSKYSRSGGADRSTAARQLGSAGSSAAQPSRLCAGFAGYSRHGADSGYSRHSMEWCLRTSLIERTRRETAV